MQHEQPVADERMPRPGQQLQPPSPLSSPSSARRQQGGYSDRFIPSRKGGMNLQDSFALLPDSPPRKRDAPQDGGKDDNLDTYTMLLRSELLGSEPHSRRKSDDSSASVSPQRNLFRYRSVFAPRDEAAAYALSPVGADSHLVLCSPRRAPRKIPTVPYKVLDAPALQAPHRCPHAAGSPACPPRLVRRRTTFT